jgi:hypothetical protein
MAIKPILESWKRFFPELPPVGFLLRKNRPEQWLRFHTLPNAKRIPKSASEVEEVLQRMSQISEEVFEPRTQAALWITSFNHLRPSFPKEQWAGFEAVAEPPPTWTNALQDHIDVQHMTIWVRAKEWDWEHVAFFFREVSLDRLDYVTAFSVHTGAAICPYDGGIDTFLSDAHKRTALKRKFKNWLP